MHKTIIVINALNFTYITIAKFGFFCLLTYSYRQLYHKISNILLFNGSGLLDNRILHINKLFKK